MQPSERSFFLFLPDRTGQEFNTHLQTHRYFKASKSSTYYFGQCTNFRQDPIRTVQIATEPEPLDKGKQNKCL